MRLRRQELSDPDEPDGPNGNPNQTGRLRLLQSPIHTVPHEGRIILHWTKKRQMTEKRLDPETATCHIVPHERR